MIFAEVDTTPIWTTGGAVALLATLGGGARWLLNWFKEVASAQQAHEKSLSDKWANHENEQVKTANEHEKATIKELDGLFLRYDAVCSRFDVTVKDLHQQQAKEASQTISTLLAIQKEMLNAVLALRQQSEKVEALVVELRNQVERNASDVRQALKLFPQPKVDRVRKLDQ